MSLYKQRGKHNRVYKLNMVRQKHHVKKVTSYVKSRYDSLSKAIKEARLMRAGMAQGQSLDDFLNELEDYSTKVFKKRLSTH